MARRLIVALILVVCLEAKTAEAVPLTAFPPDVRSFIIALLKQAPPDAQYQNLVAIQRLSLQGSRRVVAVIYAYANAGMMNTYLLNAAFSEYVRSHYVAPNMQQAFVDGLWGVSPAEERLSQQVFQVIIGRLQGQIGGPLPPPVTGPGWGLGGGIPPQQFLQMGRDMRCQFLPPEQRSACQ